MLGKIYNVSILVLVDVGLKPNPKIILPMQKPVSILVLVDVGLKPETGLRSEHFPNPVSILVLVDVGLKLEDKMWQIRIYGSFNPCFGGCWS